MADLDKRVGKLVALGETKELARRRLTDILPYEEGSEMYSKLKIVTRLRPVRGGYSATAKYELRPEEAGEQSAVVRSGTGYAAGGLESYLNSDNL